MFVRLGKAPLSRASREIKQFLCVQSLILYYIKQIDSMLPCICPVTDHRGRQNVVRTSAIFLFLPHFDVICDLLLDRCTATWNLFVNYTITKSMRALWLVNQLWFIVPVNPWKNRASSEWNVGRTLEEFVNHSPAARDLQILLVFYQPPAWFISL